MTETLLAVRNDFAAEDAPLNNFVRKFITDHGWGDTVPNYDTINWMAILRKSVRRAVEKYPPLRTYQDEVLSRVFGDLFGFSESGQGARMNAYDPTRGTKFPDYVAHAANNIAANAVRDLATEHGYINPRPIEQGREKSDTPGAGVAEGQLGSKGMNVLDEMAESETIRDFMKWIQTQREGWFLEWVVGLLLDNPGIKQKEIAEMMNEGGAAEEKGRPVTPSDVQYAVTRVFGEKGNPGLLEIYAQGDPDFAEKVQKAKQQKQAPTPTKTQGDLYFPTQDSPGVPIKVLSRGAKSVTFVVQDGPEKGKRYDRIPKDGPGGHKNFNF